jgi:hypothetical protein
MNNTDYTETVRSLNAELSDKFHEDYRGFSYVTNGYYDIIKFDDEYLWNSDDDERQWIETKGDYEDLETFIRKQFKKYVKELNKLKL